MSKFGLFMKRNGPTIAMAVGTVAQVTSIVLAIKRAPKASQAITVTKDEIAKAKELRDAGELTYEKENNDGTVELITEPYTKSDYQKDLVSYYTTGVGRLFRATWPVLIATGISIGCYWGGYGAKSKALTATSAALAATATSFAQYRQRAIEDVGTDKDREYLTGVRKVEVTTVDDEGNETTEDGYILDKSVNDPNGPLFNAFTIRIDERNSTYRQNMDPIYLESWLKMMEDTINRIYHEDEWISGDKICDILDVTPYNSDVDWNVARAVGRVLKDDNDWISLGCWQINDNTGDKELSVIKDVEGAIYLTFDLDKEPLYGRIPKKTTGAAVRAARKYPVIER